MISEITSNQVDRVLIELINNIAHAMGMVTIAECVEDESTKKILTEINIDFVQGHFIARPADSIEPVIVTKDTQYISPTS